MNNSIIETNHHYKDALTNLTILYVEDEEIIKENITKVLKLLCKKCISFSNAHDALEYFKKNSIDIIITDINLPNMDGIDFVRQLRDIDEKVPIIFLTAYLETDYLLEGIRNRIIDYLNKPVDFEVLLNSLLKATKDILDNGRYKIKLKNSLEYDVLNKKLLDLTKGEYIKLTSNESKLFDLLIKNRHRVVKIDEIKDTIWQDSYEATESALKNLLNKLRNKIGKESILNISKVGYKIEVL
ncbi:two-component system response regulator [Malaciobacter mytili LMG 24559]|uniref:response regulator transcription factor n=1 Tax=Malaciobacter mytili TaxID=603050 RepID=UPI000E100295|nr:response regulator [Malaciobacter mytili]AXH16069.1 two-component system response regulator [Malaciobacter mytili LMG 24559]